MGENEQAPAPESKAEWIHYAISHGEEPDVAVNMTLEELTEKYGAAFEPKFATGGLITSADDGTDAVPLVLDNSTIVQRVQVRTFVCPVCGLEACHHNLAKIAKEA